MSEKIVTLNEEVIKGQLKELVRGSVEETLNELLEKEAEKLTQAARYERNEERQGYRSVWLNTEQIPGASDDLGLCFYSEPLAFLRFPFKTAIVHFSGLEMSGSSADCQNTTFSDWHNLVWLCPYSPTPDYRQPPVSATFCLFHLPAVSDQKPRQNPTISDRILRNPFLREIGEVRKNPLFFAESTKKPAFTGWFLVEVTGFEPATFWSRTKRATKLRYTSLSWSQ